MEEIFSKFNKDIAWLKDRTVLHVISGSHSHGTNIEGSDLDTRGICIPPKQYYLGNATFEQAELKEPDCTIFEIRKAFRLLADCNMNVLEMLFVEPSDYLMVDPIGEELIANRHKFLSKRIKHAACGYAIGQLKRIKTHRRWLLHPVKDPPTRKEFGLPEKTLIPQDQMMAAQAAISKELERYNFDFVGELSEPMKINLTNIMSEMLAELKITSEDKWLSAARTIGLSDNFIALMQKEREYLGRKREYDQYQNWKETRNVKRAADEEKFGYDLKHAAHLYRLMRSCREVLTTGNLLVKRPDAQELIAIRRGALSYDEIVEFAEREDKELQTIYETSDVLPKTPDFDALNALCMRLIEKSLSKYSWYSIRKAIDKMYNQMIGGTR